MPKQFCSKRAIPMIKYNSFAFIDKPFSRTLNFVTSNVKNFPREFFMFDVAKISCNKVPHRYSKETLSSDNFTRNKTGKETNKRVF